jgi:aminoglycoside phosphotransferase family enzyme/predicted kinase
MRESERAPHSSTVADQAEVFSLLGDPATFGLTAPVRRIDTHGAAVFLAGGDAYKVKRAVRFPFMDFSTLEKRRAACEAEIAVNKPNAPYIYLGVVPIARTARGLSLGGPGQPVEWAVHMRRFDEEATLDRLADRQALPLEVIAKLAWVILRSHQRAPLRDGEAATRALERYLDQNDEAFAARPDLFEPGRARRLAADARASLAACRSLLVERGGAGYVRRCHGDLHLRNIALIDGEPVLFDAVEFDDGIATGDELYDLAFLLMDLEERGLRRAGNLVLNRYLWESDEAQLSGLAALPVFLSIRSAIRAKVIAAGLDHLHGEERDRAGAEASRYFWFAEAFLTPVPVRLLAIGGLSGTGKSTLAADLAPCLGRAPGAVLLRSDIERKKLFNVAETDKLPDSAYGEAANEQVYKRLCGKAALALRAGQAVVLDAVHSRAEERIAVEGVASRLGAAFSGLWLEAPLSVRLDRVGHRKRDASDADVAVAAAQASSPGGAMTWRRLDASGDSPATLEAARALLGLPRAPDRSPERLRHRGAAPGQ